MVAATVASDSGFVPYVCMWRRAMRANSAAVNMPYDATNSFVGRVHGAVERRSVYTPADPALISTVVARPVAIAADASSTAGMPSCDIDRHTGPLRAW